MTHTLATGQVSHQWPPSDQVSYAVHSVMYLSINCGTIQILIILFCRCWSSFTQWPHLCGWRLWWCISPRLCWGIQHQNRLLDHRCQYDYSTLLRWRNCSAGTPIRYCRVRNCLLGLINEEVCDFDCTMQPHGVIQCKAIKTSICLYLVINKNM